MLTFSFLTNILCLRNLKSRPVPTVIRIQSFLFNIRKLLTNLPYGVNAMKDETSSYRAYEHSHYSFFSSPAPLLQLLPRSRGEWCSSTYHWTTQGLKLISTKCTDFFLPFSFSLFPGIFHLPHVKPKRRGSVSPWFYKTWAATFRSMIAEIPWMALLSKTTNAVDKIFLCIFL